MGLFSFLKREKQLKCDWCGEELETPAYVKFVGGTNYNFCSESCKKNFRKSGKGRSVHRPCPTCALSR